MNKIKDCKYGKMIYNSTDMWIGRSIEHYGEFSEFETQFLCNLLSEGDVAIDVGANIGALTLPMANKVGKEGMVIAIEPQQYVYHMLCGNLAINNIYNVTTFQRAASNRDEILWVPYIDYNAGGNYGGVSLEHQGQLGQMALEGKCYPVAAMTIDQLHLGKVNLIKVDVEGMELEVLKGAEKTIQRYRPFLYVESDREHKRQDLKNYLDHLGYTYDMHMPPLFNEGNFAKNRENVIDKDFGRRYVSGNLFCYDANHPSRKRVARFAIDSCPQFFQEESTKMGTTSSAYEWRCKMGDFEKYLHGNGIDIGSGHCPLVLEEGKGTVAEWDTPQGDATYMENAPDNHYDFVYSSHCLEHLEDVPTALQNWIRILKPGGYLFVVVPDWELYEKTIFPSLFNEDHKSTFSTTKTRADSRQRINHWHINENIKPILEENGVELLEVRLEDHRYDYSLPRSLDQTKLRNALAQVCFIGRKK